MNQDEPEIWTRLNECECVKNVFGSFISRDLGWNTELCAYVEVNGIMGSHPEILWIPPLYDPIRPERSLWGIAGGTANMTWAKLVAFVESDRPDLALARAIIEQEGRQ